MCDLDDSWFITVAEVTRRFLAASIRVDADGKLWISSSVKSSIK